MTDNAIIRFLIKENFKETYQKLEKTGGSISLNNTVNKWILSLFIQGVSEMYSVFIWDLLLLEGNIIIFKAVYAMIIILEKHLRKHKSIESINKIFNEIPLELNQRGKLAYYLIGKKFNFNMDLIRKYRKTISPQIIKEIMGLNQFKTYENDCKDNKQNGKNGNSITCDLDWPICIKDQKNLEKEYDYIVLKELDKPNVIEDYMDLYESYKSGLLSSSTSGEKNKKVNFLNDDDIESKKNHFFKEERFKDLLIERKKHYCDSNLMTIRKNIIKPEKKCNTHNNDCINVLKMSHTMNSNDINDIKNNEINVTERNRRINTIISRVSKDNANKIAFIKEKIEKNIFFDEDKK